MPTDLIEAWHVLVGIGLGVPLLYSRWIKPTLDWRKDTEIRLVRAEMRLDTGGSEFKEIKEEIRLLKEAQAETNILLGKIETVLKHSVFRGVGEVE